MEFSINLLHRKAPRSLSIADRGHRGVGIIQIGEFKETFYPLLTYWNETDYRNQWNEAIARITSNKFKKAALIVDMPDFPYDEDLLVWWLIYRSGEKVYLRQQLKRLVYFKKPFDKYNIYKYVPTRKTDENGNPMVSEWSTSIADLIRERGKNKRV